MKPVPLPWVASPGWPTCRALRHSWRAILGSVEEWQEWARACRSGLRKSLGWDAGRRRYWALGGGAGAWRVYVEDADGKRWGWYDGASPSHQGDLNFNCK